MVCRYTKRKLGITTHSLVEKVDEGSARRFLVYTSAGDRANVRQWLRGRRDFDVWITYYGDHPGTFADIGEYYEARKGAKFPNLCTGFQARPDILNRYEAVMVCDDDIHISARALNRLFRIREQFDLWVLQPAFHPLGKTSWPITIRQPDSLLRYTNFVENGCPLFRTDKLIDVLSDFPMNLVGHGVDWYYLHTLGQNLVNRYAVVDSVSCFNPPDRLKGRAREVTRLQSIPDQQKQWRKVKSERTIETWPHETHSRVSAPLLWRWIRRIRYWPAAYYYSARKRRRKRLKTLYG